MSRNSHLRCYMAMVEGANETEGRRLTPPAPSRGVRTVLMEPFGALPRKSSFVHIIIIIQLLCLAPAGYSTASDNGA
jgi:hypothetical protein